MIYNNNNTTNMMTLPSNYQPSEYTVVIGKGRVPMQANGTKYLRVLVQNHLEEYSQAQNKTEKSKIVTTIINIIQDNCVDDGITFVKYDNGIYTHVPENLRREKIAATFRDLLSFKYKSSSQNKTAKRRQARKVQRMERQKRIQQRLQQQHLRSALPIMNFQFHYSLNVHHYRKVDEHFLLLLSWIFWTILITPPLIAMMILIHNLHEHILLRMLQIFATTDHPHLSTNLKP